MKLDNEQLFDLMILRMRSDDSVDAPRDSIKYAKDLFRMRVAEPKQSAIRRVLGVLRSELSSGKLAFGERSSGESKARQMLFDSGDNAVDLRIKRSGNDFSISAQILGIGFEGGTAMLKGVEGVIETIVQVDAMSEFKFDRVGAGDYALVIRGIADEIMIETLTVG